METLELVRSDYVAGRIGLDQFEDDVCEIVRGNDPKRFRDGCQGRLEWVRSVFAQADDEDRELSDEELGQVDGLLKQIGVLKKEEEWARRPRAELTQSF